MKRRLISYLFTVISIFCCHCGSITDRADTSISSPLIGHWQYVESYIVQQWNNDTIARFKLDSLSRPLTILDPFSNLIITNNFVYHYRLVQPIPNISVCPNTELRYTSVGDSFIIYHQFVATYWLHNDTIAPQMLGPDTLVMPDSWLTNGAATSFDKYCRIKDSVLSFAPLDCQVRGPSIEGCVDWNSDKSLPLIIAFWDSTPYDTLDQGVFVNDVRLQINGKYVQAKATNPHPFPRCFVKDRENILLPRNLPMSRFQDGFLPTIVQFDLKPDNWIYSDTSCSEDCSDSITTIKFIAEVSGNFRASVLTGEQDFAAIYDNSQRFDEPIKEVAIIEASKQVNQWHIIEHVWFESSR